MERCCELLDSVAFSVGLLAGVQQFLFVRTPIPRVEQGGADQQRLPVSAGLDLGGHQYGKPIPVACKEIQGDTVAAVLTNAGSSISAAVNPPR